MLDCAKPISSNEARTERAKNIDQESYMCICKQQNKTSNQLLEEDAEFLALQQQQEIAGQKSGIEGSRNFPG
ncbi:unnamed protein product [Gongylonema pulchrum]|uniref:Uncharacterized protein n=1 Tax=Gongylonema pulchrum TaxID=637853 RepID=A0A183DW93_9BILA|nr:unnamed protein product [Gongylonema pulchrum]